MAVAGAGQLSQNLFRKLEVLVHRVGQILVEGAAVGRRHAGDVVESLGAALDFEAVHARVADEVEEGRGTHIVGVEDVAAVLVLADLIELARAGLLAEIVLPAAGLGALAAVCVAACHVVGEQAAARDAHAHGAVNESLDFQLRRGLVAEGSDVLQGHLPGQHHPLRAHVVGGAGSGPVGNAGLGGHMDVDVGRERLAGVQHAEVGHDEGVHTGSGSVLDGLRQTVSLLVGGQGVHGQVDLAAPGVGIDDALAQLLRGEVGGCRAHPELGQRAVDGVRAVVDGIPQALEVACRGQKFRYL